MHTIVHPFMSHPGMPPHDCMVVRGAGRSRGASGSNGREKPLDMHLVMFQCGGLFSIIMLFSSDVPFGSEYHSVNPRIMEMTGTGGLGDKSLA